MTDQREGAFLTQQGFQQENAPSEHLVGVTELETIDSRRDALGRSQEGKDSSIVNE